MEKQCQNCYHFKPANEFFKKLSNNRHRYTFCKPCNYERAPLKKPTKKKKPPFTATHHALMKKYGISEKQYKLKFAIQWGLCYICKKPEEVKRNGVPLKLAVDHCHTTNQIRDLLCTKCNRAVGLIKENSETARQMFEYLKRWGK